MKKLTIAAIPPWQTILEFQVTMPSFVSYPSPSEAPATLTGFAVNGVPCSS